MILIPRVDLEFTQRPANFTKLHPTAPQSDQDPVCSGSNRAEGPGLQYNQPQKINVTTSILALVLAALLLPLLVLLWATESTEGRARRLSRSGWSQRRIAEHMGVTRYRVRLALA